MPVSLNRLDFPQVYTPWYKKRCQLTGNTAFSRYDILVPNNAGTYAPAPNDAVLTGGYVCAVEAYKSGADEVECVLPGSVIPAEVQLGASEHLATGEMVKLNVAANQTRVVVADAADLAAGKVLGRIRMRIRGGEEKMCRAFADADIATVHTGCF